MDVLKLAQTLEIHRRIFPDSLEEGCWICRLRVQMGEEVI